MKKVASISIFCLFYFFLVSMPSYAQFGSTANICLNKPCVKLQNGHLWVLSSDDVTYVPYFVKAVGYSPTPVGRYPSDWGYPATDPRSTINNIFDDPAILNRDYSNLQKMNANTIRIYKGNNTKLASGRFPSYITTASTTINKDTTQNTLDLAQKYGLKVIAGFWVNFLSFDANNNISSVDENGNPVSRQQIINNFVNYVNALKSNRAILFWAIGNENNYEVLNASTVPVGAFEKAFGTTYGDSIFNWLQETGNFLDEDDDIIVDLNSSAIFNILKTQYPADCNSILYTLKQYSGQALNAAQLTAWYSLVDAMAKAAHQAEGGSYHPVTIVNGEIANIGNSSYGTTDAQMPDLDIWGANVYRGKSFGTLFGDYAAKSQKPLWISEYGIDAWSVNNTAGINNWGLTLSQDLNSTGFYDPATQSAWDVALWNEIFNNTAVSIGGAVFEYTDEWWKPYEFYCTNPNASQDDNNKSSGLCNSNQKYYGSPYPGFPDGFMNQEWFGIASISPSNVVGAADIITPRQVYNDLTVQWANVPVLNGTLVDTLTQQPLTDLTGALSWPSSPTAQGLWGSSVGVNPLTFPNFAMYNLSQGTYKLVFNLFGHMINYNLTIGPNSPYNYTTLKIPVPIVKSSAGTGGTISPLGAFILSSGANQGFTITAKPGYNIDQVIIDGATVLPYVSVNSYAYTFTNVTSAHTIAATFKSKAPSVILVTNSYSYSAPASVYLSAFASEPGGSISKVEFYNGTTLINTATLSTSVGQYNDYVYIWNNATPGNYSLTAKVYDSFNASAVSAPATFTITGLPTVNLTVNSITANAPGSFTLTAAASEANGAIKRVDFYNGPVYLGTASSSPYVYHWNGVPMGSYNLTAAAYDYSNKVTISTPVNVLVSSLNNTINRTIKNQAPARI